MFHSMSNLKSIVIVLLSMSISMPISVSATPLEAGDSIRASDNKPAEDSPVHVAHAIRMASDPAGVITPREALVHIPGETEQGETEQGETNRAIDQNEALRIWRNISGHVLDGNSRNNNAGRHLTSSWLETHGGAQPNDRKDDAGILQFDYIPVGGMPRNKTVWNDNNTGIYRTDVTYDRNDVQSLCIQVIRLSNPIDDEFAFVVRKMNSPLICVRYVREATCYPLMTDVSRLSPNARC